MKVFVSVHEVSVKGCMRGCEGARESVCESMYDRACLMYERVCL